MAVAVCSPAPALAPEAAWHRPSASVLEGGPCLSPMGLLLMLAKHATPAAAAAAAAVAQPHLLLCPYRRSLATPRPSSRSLHAIASATLSHDAAPSARAIFESGYTLITRCSWRTQYFRSTLPWAPSGHLRLFMPASSLYPDTTPRRSSS